MNLKKNDSSAFFIRQLFFHEDYGSSLIIEKFDIQQCLEPAFENKKNVASNPCIDYWQHCNIIQKNIFSRNKTMIQH